MSEPTPWNSDTVAAEVRELEALRATCRQAVEQAQAIVTVEQLVSALIEAERTHLAKVDGLKREEASQQARIEAQERRSQELSARLTQLQQHTADEEVQLAERLRQLQAEVDRWDTQRRHLQLESITRR